MLRSAHSMRRTPSPARARSFTSCLRVVAISPLLLWVGSSCGEQPLVLPLLPVERVDSAAVQPRLERGPQVGLAPEPRREDDVADLDGKAPTELPQRLELVQLAQSVQAVAGGRPVGHDEAGRLEIAEHPSRPARLPCGFSHLHAETLP